MSGVSLAAKLAKLRREGEERDAQRRARKLGVSYIDFRKVPVAVDAVELVPEEEAKRAQAATVELKAKKVAFAAFDPTTNEAQAIVNHLEEEKYDVRVFVCSKSGLTEVWRLYEYVPKEVTAEITGKFQVTPEDLADVREAVHDFKEFKKKVAEIDFRNMATNKLFEFILLGSLATDASDIHLEAEEGRGKLRFRIDGLLHDVFDGIPEENYKNVISRLKLFSRMKINVHGEPQDGRFSISLPKKEVEVRVSVIPAQFGETAVMRILDPDAISVDLTKLGLRDDDLELVKHQIAKPNGLILNTGPTGSGKTTTLYAFLRYILHPEIKIITVEDPIEYEIEGIEQTQVNPDVGYTFAGGLRAIVRQDPDVILVGEIRDFETADIAIQASLTGHLVLSTLHTNDAVGAIPRLINLGVKTMAIGPALSLVIAQRLVRRLCEHCKKPVSLPDEMKANIDRFLKRLPPRVDRTPYKDFRVYEAVGCKVCHAFGYKGRVAIFEFFKGGPEVEEAILKEVSEVVLKQIAQEQQMVSMQEDGVLTALSGVTTFREVEEVTGPIKW